MKRSPKPGDASQRAAVVQEATGQAELARPKDGAAVARCRAGGLARAERLTAERRREIAIAARSARRITE